MNAFFFQYADVDSDGYGNSSVNWTGCPGSKPADYTLNDSDCDDGDPDEVPFQIWYADLDGDGYGDGTSIVQCERPAGYFLEGGSKFDSSVDRGHPLEFPLGQGRVIAGWDEGIALMNKGAKYKLLIPYWLGYGLSGSGPIRPYDALLFDVELMEIK